MDALLNITFAGENGDLKETVDFDATDDQIRIWATEAVRAGGIPGISAHPDVDFTSFVVDRFSAKDDLPCRVVLRPKTPFGTP